MKYKVKEAYQGKRIFISTALPETSLSQPLSDKVVQAMLRDPNLRNWLEAVPEAVVVAKAVETKPEMAMAETLETETNELTETTEADISAMTIVQRKEYAEAMNYPSEEWEALGKAELGAYLIEKLSE